MKFAIVRNHMQIGGVEVNLRALAIEIKKAGYDIDVWVWSTHGNIEMIKSHQQHNIPLKVGIPKDFNEYDVIIAWDPRIYPALKQYKGKLFCIIGNRSEGYYGPEIRDNFPVAGCICDSADTTDFVRSFSKKVPTIIWHFMIPPDELNKPRDNRYGLLNNHIVFGTMCSMRKQKCLDRIIKGFAKFLATKPECSPFLLIGGEGPMRKEWETLAKQILPGHRFSFAGWMNSGRIGHFLSALDCFIHSTSADQGGICMSMCNATGAGCIIVTNDIAGVSENLVDGTTYRICSDKMFDENLPHFLNDVVEMRSDFAIIRERSRLAYASRYKKQGSIVEWLTQSRYLD